MHERPEIAWLTEGGKKPDGWEATQAPYGAYCSMPKSIMPWGGNKTHGAVVVELEQPQKDRSPQMLLPRKRYRQSTRSWPGIGAGGKKKKEKAVGGGRSMWLRAVVVEKSRVD